MKPIDFIYRFDAARTEARQLPAAPARRELQKGNRIFFTLD
jgi:hypothetical protein